MQNFQLNSLISFLNTRKLQLKSFWHFFGTFWSIVKRKDDFLFIYFFVTFLCNFLAIFWYIIVKNATFEVKMPKTMIDFDRVFY